MALALPMLSPLIPTCVHMPSGNQLAAPLAIALLEANVITAEMLAPPNNTLCAVFAGPDEAALASLGLSTWWDKARAEHPSGIFHWNLHVQQNSNPWGYLDGDDKAWFCITRAVGDMPTFTLAENVLKLESIREGFGQTALSVLYDAMRLLPDSLTPYQAHDWAEWLHWGEYADDSQMMAEYREDHDLPPDAEIDAFTRAEFFANMPEWVVKPVRTVARSELVELARDRLSKDVIAACDAVIEAVSVNKFCLKSSDVGANQASLDSIDGCVILLWRENDSVGRAIDDALNTFGEGECTEWIDARPVALNAASIKKYQVRTEQILRLAGAVEFLIETLGEKL